MIDRRQFLLSATPATAAVAMAADAPSPIRMIDIVHHTHTDVGYTEPPAVVRDLQMRYLDTAIDTCKRDSSFRWTVESLLGLDDWWKAATNARREAFLEQVRAGHIDVMGMPFNQTPCMDAAQWRQAMAWIPESLRQQLDIRVAMQNDVNGMPRAGAMALLSRGVSRLLVGLNSDSGGPPFQRLTPFWWRMPDGRRMFVWLGEHYGSVMNYLRPARDLDHYNLAEDRIRAAHAEITKRVQAIQAQGYAFDRIILTHTHPLHYDNGGAFPSLSPFVAKWNQMGLQPALRLTTATDAMLTLEKEVGTRIAEKTGEWTDWWANGDASSPREVAASRRAKRLFHAAGSSVFGPPPASADAVSGEILRGLCLFDEHTWGAAQSVSQPYSFETLGQFVEKSELAFRPMGRAEAYLNRRIRARLAETEPGTYAINPGPVELSGFVRPPGSKTDLWVEKLGAHSLRLLRDGDPAPSVGTKPEIALNAQSWPERITYPGMSKPLIEGACGEFLAVNVIPPADRRTIANLHDKWDAGVRNAALKESVADYGTARSDETPHTLRWTQEFRHARIALGRRVLTVWKREPRARISVQFDRTSSIAPEVLYLDFRIPGAGAPPVVSSGGVPFTPYRDQLQGSCKDYFAIDAWAHYHTGSGDWLWVTKDAPLVAIGGPHVVELHQTEPADAGRILAMVFDNCWHTNFVADSHGLFSFEFDILWRSAISEPQNVALGLQNDLLAAVQPAKGMTAEEIEDLYRR